MKIKIIGRGIEITDGLRQAVEDKLSKLEKYFVPDTEIIARLSVEKDSQKIEVTIPVKGTIIRAEEESSDMYATIDLVLETIERQLVKHKNKLDHENNNFSIHYSALIIGKHFCSEVSFQNGSVNDKRVILLK